MKYETAIGLCGWEQSSYEREADLWAAMERALHQGYAKLEDADKQRVMELLERARKNIEPPK